MIVAGFGFRASARADSLRDALDLARGGHEITALATAGDKADAPPLRALARALDLPVIALPPERIAAIQTPTQSARVRQARATGSLAEAAALAGAGTGARLVSPRHISQDRKATCAIAIGGDT